jgi:hypothetical protein
MEPNSQAGSGVLALLSQLSQARTQAVVSAGLAQRFPTEQDWQAALDDPAFLLLLEEFAAALFQAQADLPVETLGVSPDTPGLDEVYERTLVATYELAAYVGVPAEDLLLYLLS